MNMLIIGGLFGIALLAIMGVVLMVVGERNAVEQAQVAKPAPAPVAMKQVVAPAPASPASEPASPEPATASAEPTLSEQVYELSAQLSELYQQAQSLESRLSTLMALTERLEYANVTPVYNLMDEKLPLTPIPVE